MSQDTFLNVPNSEIKSRLSSNSLGNKSRSMESQTPSPREIRESLDRLEKKANSKPKRKKSSNGENILTFKEKHSSQVPLAAFNTQAIRNTLFSFSRKYISEFKRPSSPNSSESSDSENSQEEGEKGVSLSERNRGSLMKNSIEKTKGFKAVSVRALYDTPKLKKKEIG